MYSIAGHAVLQLKVNLRVLAYTIEDTVFQLLVSSSPAHFV